MKLNVIIILFCLLSISLRAQTMYRMDMDVQEFGFNDSKLCTPDTPVIWGIKFDTVCFMFTSNHMCFYPVKDSTKISSEKRLLIAKHIERNKTSILVQDGYNEKYIITVNSNQESGKILIFITNIDYGFPSYVLSFGTQICN